MILDAYAKLSAAEAITASAASESYIDTLAAGQAQDPLQALLKVDVEADSAGDAGVLDLTIQTDTVANFASPTTLATFPQLAQAALVAGADFKISLPKDGAQRYIRGYYTVSGANFSAGNFTLALVKDADIGTV